MIKPIIISYKLTMCQLLYYRNTYKPREYNLQYECWYKMVQLKMKNQVVKCRDPWRGPASLTFRSLLWAKGKSPKIAKPPPPLILRSCNLRPHVKYLFLFSSNRLMLAICVIWFPTKHIFHILLSTSFSLILQIWLLLSFLDTLSPFWSQI